MAAITLKRSRQRCSLLV